MRGAPSLEARLSTEVHIRVFRMFIYEHNLPWHWGAKKKKKRKSWRIN